LHATCEQLLTFPFAHPELPQLAAGLRVTFYEGYAIYYQADEQAVILVRVLHGARDLTGLATQGGFK